MVNSVGEETARQGEGNHLLATRVSPGLTTYAAAWGAVHNHWIDATSPGTAYCPLESRHYSSPETCTTSTLLQLSGTSLLPANLFSSPEWAKRNVARLSGRCQPPVGKGSFGSPVAGSCSLSAPWCSALTPLKAATITRPAAPLPSHLLHLHLRLYISITLPQQQLSLHLLLHSSPIRSQTAVPGRLRLLCPLLCALAFTASLACPLWRRLTPSP